MSEEIRHKTETKGVLQPDDRTESKDMMRQTR